MTQPLSSKLRQSFLRFLQRHYGLRFSGARAPALDYGVWRTCSSLDIPADALLRGVLMGDVTLRQQLLETVTVGETYFFREPRHFRWLEGFLRATDKPVHLWSAGCSSGEEAYSMAISALETLGPIAHERVRITGTDLNPSALRRALRAEYREWSFRSVPPHLRERWFRQNGELWTPLDEARRLVAFRPFNLANDARKRGPRHVHVAFCRNVTTYLCETARSSAAHSLAAALTEDGLVVCASGDPPLNADVLQRCRVGEIACYRRAVPTNSVRLTETAFPTGADLLRPVLPRRRTRIPFTSQKRPQPSQPDLYQNSPLPTAARPVPRANATTVYPELSKQTDTGKMLAQLDAAVSDSPEDPTLYLLRALVHQQAGAHQAVVRDARRALLLNSRSVYAHALIALSALPSGQHSLAARAIRTGQRLVQDLDPLIESGFCDGLTTGELEMLFDTLERFSASLTTGTSRN